MPVLLIAAAPALLLSSSISAIATGTKEKPSTQALIDLLRSNAGAAAIKNTGMEPIDQNLPAK